MLRKIITVVLFALIAISSSFALTDEADTVWTRNLGFSAIRLDFVQNDEFIIVSGSNGVYRIRTLDGKVINGYKKFTSLYGFNQDKTKLIFSNDFSLFTMDFDTEIISDSIVIEKTNEFKYVDGDTTNPWDESYLLAPLTSPDGKYILCSWFRSGYRFNSYEPEFIETRTIIIINKETKKIEKEIKTVPSAVCFSPDGNYLAIGKSGDEGIVELYSGKTFEYIKRVVILEGTIKEMNFSYNNKYLCNTFGTEQCNVIDIDNNEIVFPTDSNKNEFICKAIFYNKKNILLYKEVILGNNEIYTKYKEFNIDNKEINVVFNNWGIWWYYPGIYCISKNDNLILSKGYLDKNGSDYFLIQNNTTKVEEKNEIKKSSINIIPNPIENILKIEFNNKRVNKIEIIDINGNSIFKEEINIEKNSKVINTSSFLSGTYFLRITINQEIKTFKFVKE